MICGHIANSVSEGSLCTTGHGQIESEVVWYLESCVLVRRQLLFGYYKLYVFNLCILQYD